MSKRRWLRLGASVGIALCGGVALAQGGFDRAIESAVSRTVKFYGLKVGRQVGYGSGILVSRDGYILTVYTLLLESSKLRVVTPDGVRFHGELVEFDRDVQLALVRITGAIDGEPGTTSFPYFDLTYGNGSTDSPSSVDAGEPDLLPGDWVIAAGNPFKVAEGAEPASIAHGVYSTRTRLDARRKVNEFPYHGEVLVIDAVTSNPGAPGGPLVNLKGQLVGMIGRVVVSNQTHTRLNYAIPRDVLQGFIARVRGSETSGDTTASKNPLGEVDGVDPGIRLVRTGYMRLPPFVERVRRGSPAAMAGVREDDLILSVNGYSVPDVEDYDQRMGRIADDEPIDLVIQRKKRIITLRIIPQAASRRQ